MAFNFSVHKDQLECGLKCSFLVYRIQQGLQGFNFRMLGLAPKICILAYALANFIQVVHEPLFMKCHLKSAEVTKAVAVTLAIFLGFIPYPLGQPSLQVSLLACGHL